MPQQHKYIKRFSLFPFVSPHWELDVGDLGACVHEAFCFALCFCVNIWINRNLRGKHMGALNQDVASHRTTLAENQEAKGGAPRHLFCMVLHFHGRQLHHLAISSSTHAL